MRRKRTGEPKKERRKRGRLKRSRSAPITETTGVPLTSEDGMTWLDLQGDPPDADEKGRLRKPFILRLVRAEGEVVANERWGEGLVLPLTPKAHEAWVAEVIAEREKRAKKHHEPTPDSDEEPKQELTPTGRRRRRSDKDLTPEQQAKRDKRRARREARKKRLAS